MKEMYNNALGMMLQGDEELSEIIQRFVDGFPKPLVEKIGVKSKGKAFKDGKAWYFEDTGKDFCISVGSSGNSRKDYMNLYLSGVSSDDLRIWPRYQGDRLIGYLTLYLYKKEKHRGDPMQVRYDFYAIRSNKNVYVRVDTSFNSSFKENAESLEENGLSEMHSRMIDRMYQIDTEAILKNKKRI